VFRRQLSGSKNLWLMRLYYLAYFGAMGSVNPFVNLFYVHNGLSGTEIGVLNTISAISGMVSAPLWGRLNDNVRRPRLLLQATLALNALAYYFLSQQTAFLYMAILIGFNAFISSGINPASQAQALLAAAEGGAYYGSVRMWGSAGWAIMSALSGLIIQRTSLVSAFVAFLVLNLLAAGILFWVHTPQPVSQTEIKGVKQSPVPMKEVFHSLIKNRELTCFLLALVSVWVLANGVNFESVYLQQLGASEGLIGWENTIGAVIEFPMMLLSDRIMRKRGSKFTLLIGFFSYMLACSAIVIHPSVVSFFLYRAINGVSLSLYSVSFTYFIVERAPAGQSGTMLALYSVTIAGLLSILMSPVSGRLFDLIGPYWLYVMALVGYTLAAGFILFGVILHPRRRKAAEE
jgi:PPP family 3-phenylpropionic acid transporter